MKEADSQRVCFFCYAERNSMPNWVANQITLPQNNPREVFKNFIVKTEEGESFDFNKLIPRPEELNVISGSITNTAIAVYLYRVRNVSSKIEEIQKRAKEYGWKDYPCETLEEVAANEEKKYLEAAEYAKKNADKPFNNAKEYEKYPTLVLLGERYVKNMEEFGSYDWYDWSCKHWGVKWNASSFYCDDNYISFDTPWGYPAPIFKKLCKLFPDIEMDFRWDEEQGYWGELTNVNGDLVETDNSFTDFNEEEE